MARFEGFRISPFVRCADTSLVRGKMCKRDSIIFSDEIYDRLVMDGLQHISIASMAPDLFCVTFSGLSKSHMIAGYRIGWMILSGNKRIAKDYIEGLNMLANMRMCSNVPAQ